MPIPQERHRYSQPRPEQSANKPFSFYAEQLKAEVARNPLQIGIPPRELLQRIQVKPGLTITAFATDGTLADALDARTHLFDNAYFERTKGGQKDLVAKDKVAQTFNNLVTIYDAMTYDHRSPEGRYYMQNRGYSPSMQALYTEYPRNEDHMTLDAEMSNYMIWALDTVGVPHSLKPGQNEIDVRPFYDKLVKPDPQRDAYAAKRGVLLERSTIPFDGVQGVRLQVGEVKEIAEVEQNSRRVLRVFAMQWERQRQQQVEKLQDGINAA